MASYFTEEDTRILEKTSKVREKAIDALTKDQMPSRACDVLALVSVIESLDKTILAKAKLKIDDTGNRATEETQAMMRELLLNLHRNTSSVRASRADLSLPPNIKDDISENEMVKDIDEISIKDF